MRPQSGVETRRPQGSRRGADRKPIPERSGVSRPWKLQSSLSDSLSYQSVVGQGRATGGSAEDEAKEFVPSANLVDFAITDVFGGSQAASTMPFALPALLAALRSLLRRRAGASPPGKKMTPGGASSYLRTMSAERHVPQNATRETHRTQIYSIAYFSLDPRNACAC
jgi:hypothetical protein